MVYNDSYPGRKGILAMRNFIDDIRYICISTDIDIDNDIDNDIYSARLDQQKHDKCILTDFAKRCTECPRGFSSA